MNKIQDEQWIDALPEDAVEVAEEINIEIAKVIAERIKSIGKLSPSDAHKLSNSLQYLGADFGKITKLIAKLSDRGQMAVVDTLQTVADANDEFAKVFYSGKGLAAVDWHSDPYLHNLVEAMARQTATDFTNLSNTLAYKIDERTLSLRQMYTRAIDKAIYEVHSGTVDYYTAMRKTVRQLSNDMRVVKWESGHVRRLDSHVRQNLLDGVKQLNQQMLSYHGEKFGADGVELSAHAISAPDHAPAQGRQFSNGEFEKMQTGQPFVDVKGNEYNAFRRPIGEWNCRHVAFPIIIGISQPAHTDEELRKLEENSAAKYESTQVQRALETKLRKLKNQRMVFSAAGDELEAKRTQKKINELQAKYRKFSEKQNLAYQPKRATVEGYRRISVKPIDNHFKNLHSTIDNDIIKSTQKTNIVDAMKYANGNLEVDTYAYQNMNIQAANIVNIEITKCYKIFGNLKTSGVLNSIRVVDDNSIKGVAAYNTLSKQILLRKKYVSCINPRTAMATVSSANYAVGFWSTDSPEHQIRHELGHSIEQMISQDAVKMKKISSILHQVRTDCGIFNWSLQDKEHFEIAAKHLSYYALKDEGEFIAESVAEYLAGDPRDISNTIVQIILGSDN